MTDKTLYQLPITIKLHSPLLIARTVGDENMVGSEDYIPGAVLLGAFAGLYIQKHGQINDATDKQFSSFADLFLSDQVRFLNGYPVAEDNASRTLPVPLSIQYGKTADAGAEEKLFKYMKSQAKGEAWKLVTFDSLLEEPVEEEKSSPKNGVEPTKYKAGYCLLTEENGKFCVKEVKVDKQYQIHHERTNQRVGRSANAEIYNYESIMPRQTFKTVVLGSKEKLEALKTLLTESNDSLRLGRSKHTQYGNVQAAAGKIDLLQNEAEALRATDFLQNNQFILTCTSDIVFEPDAQKTNLKAITEMVRGALNLGQDDLECIYAFFKTDVVEKYNAAWKARTPSQPCLVKGSCFVFELKSHTVEGLEDEINSLQRDGIGARRNEGYGRVLINWQGRPLAVKSKNKKEKNAPDDAVPSPPTVSPDKTLALFQGLIKNWLVEQVQVKAAEMAGKNPKNLTSTQINKLKRMAVDARTFSKFREKVEALNQNSQERLRNIHFQNQQLLDFLKNDPLEGMDFIKQELEKKSIKELLIYADYEKYKNDDDLQSTLFVAFYDSLFTLLDKSIKKGMKAREDKNDE